MLDRIAQVVLVVFGALILALLVLGLAVSCRPTAADNPPTSIAQVASATPGLATSTPTPTSIFSATLPPSATHTPVAAGGTETTQEEATSTPTATIATGATPPPQSGSGGGLTPGVTVRHGVSRGEWLIQIARCYGIPYGPLLAANPLPNPDYIVPGQILTVPNIGSQGRITGPPCVVAYTVVAGDTWESLAQRYATTTAILQRANPGSLTVGRSIWVPRVP